jgi:hypothetical protein
MHAVVLCSAVMMTISAIDPLMSFLSVSGLTVGNTYLIQVDGWGGDAGSFDMSVTTGSSCGLVNDDCSNATPITQDGGLFPGDNTGATLDGPQAACAVGGNAVQNDVWFSFVAASACVEVETFAGTLGDTKLQVLDACGGTVLGCSDDFGFSLMSLVSLTGLNVGSTYFIQVDGWSGSQGTFDVEVRSISCPGDNCAGALSITQNAPAITVNNTGYTPDGPAMACAFLGDVVTNDIWYAFTALSDCVDIQTFSNGGITDTKLQVLDACGGTVLGCNDDWNGAPDPLMSFLSLTGLTVGNTYLIQVDGWGGTAGSFDLSVTTGSSCGLVNDDCSGATPITQDGGLFPGDNTGATLDGPQAACAFFGDAVTNDVWFSFVAASACIEVQTFAGSMTDSKLQILDACGGNVLACNDDWNGFPNSLMSLVSVTGLNVGSTYFIQVDGWSGSQGTFSVEVRSTVCPGDNCADALPIVQDGGLVTVNNDGYTLDGPAMACAFFGDPVTNDIWYSFVATSSCVDIQTFTNGGIIDTKLQVLDACGGAILGCNDDWNGVPDGLMSLLSLTGLTVGNTYLIQVDGWGGDAGSFDMSVVTGASCGLANDNCADAELIVQDGGLFAGNNTGATPDGPGIGCGAAGELAVQNDVWFSFVATSECVQVETFGVTMVDSQIQLLDGCGGAVLACNDDKDPLAPDFMSRLNATGLTIGNTYYVQVDGWLGDAGAFNISVSTIACPPVCVAPTNEDCASAETLTLTAGCVSPVGFDLSCATPSGLLEGGSCITGTQNDVWYTFTSPGGTFLMDMNLLFASSVNVAAWVGGCPGSGTFVGSLCGLGSTTITFTGFASGDLITLQVASDASSAGYAEICLYAPAPVFYDCGDTFVDSGGAGGNYTDSEFNTYVFCPDNAGDFAQLDFSFFDIEDGFDFMTIYDGDNTGAPVLAVLSGAFAPFEVTAGGPTGCLTVQFESDPSVPAAGWEAVFNCIAGCTGIPAPGATTASVTEICPNVPFELSVSNELPAGISYVWQTGPSAVGPWTTIGSSTSVPVVVINQTQAAWYRARANCLASGQTGVATSVFVGLQDVCYPFPAGPISELDTDIALVEVGTGSNATDCVTPGPGSGSVVGVYSSFLNAAPHTDLVRGSVVPFNVERQQCGNFGPYDSNVAIYIDFDQSGTFELSEEVFDNGASVFATTPISGTFNIPVTAPLGQTGMRVIAAEFTTDITPDAAFSWGEVEDYIVNIVNPAVPNDFQALATNVTSGAFPTCSTSFTADLAQASDSPETAGSGNDAWYTFTATTNAVRIQVTGANDNRIELYDGATLIDSEDDVVANGNETLVFDGLTPNNQYFVAVIANAAPSAATICISHFRRSGCSAPSTGFPATFTSPCQQFKSIFTSASSYTAYFDVDGVAPFDGVSVATPNTTYHPITSFVGLPPLTGPVTYQVAVDATYNVLDAAGNPEVAIVPGTFNCTRNVVAHANIFLRDLDASPNVKPANAQIAANSWLCGSLYYEWTIEQFNDHRWKCSCSGSASCT